MHASTPTKFGLVILSALVLASLIDVVGAAQCCPSPEGLEGSLKRCRIGNLTLYDSGYDEDKYGNFDEDWDLGRRFENLSNPIDSFLEKRGHFMESDERKSRRQSLSDMINTGLMDCIIIIRYSLVIFESIRIVGQRSPLDTTINGHSVTIESAKGRFSYTVTSGRLLVDKAFKVGWDWGWGSEEVSPVIDELGWWKVEAEGITAWMKPREASMMDQLRAYKTSAGELDIRFPA